MYIPKVVLKCWSIKGDKEQAAWQIQGDQKVSVHLIITVQKSGAQGLFDHPVQCSGWERHV